MCCKGFALVNTHKLLTIMKTVTLTLIITFLLGFSVSAAVRDVSIKKDLIAYDGFSGLDYGWLASWSEMTLGGRSRVYQDCFSYTSGEVEMSYEHWSGISVKGGAYNLKVSNSNQGLESRALIRKPAQSEALQENFYVSFLVQFSEAPQIGCDYVAVGAKQYTYDTGIALGSMNNMESLGAGFARDGDEFVSIGDELPEADVTYFVVAKFIANEFGVIDEIECFVNPTSLNIERAEWDAKLYDVVTEMTSIDLQAYFHDVAYFDEIRVGKTWKSVVSVLDNSNNSYNPVGNVTTFLGPVGFWSDESKWSNGLPTIDTDTVIIEGECTVDDYFVADNVVVTASAKLLVVEGGRIDTQNPIVLQAKQGLVAEYLQDTGVVGHVVAKQEYFYGGQWNFVCVPEPMTADELFPDLQLATSWEDTVADYFMLNYSQEQRAVTEDGMVDIYNKDYPLIEGRGYIVWLNRDHVRSFEYLTSKSEMYVNTTNTTNSSTTTVSLNHSGWNLVGNPFPHSMTYEEVFDSSEHNELYFTGAVYVWDGTCYKVWSKGAGDAEARKINPMEAFFVKRTSDDPASAFFCMIDHGICDSNGCAPSLKATSIGGATNSLAISVNLMKGSNSDYTYIKMDENAVVGLDECLDGAKVFANRADNPNHDFIYSVDNADRFALNSVSLDGGFAEVPLVVDLAQAMDSIMLGFATQGDSLYSFVLVDEEDMTMKPVANGDLIRLPSGNERMIEGRFSILISQYSDESSVSELDYRHERLGLIRTHGATLVVESLATVDVSFAVVDVEGRVCYNSQLHAGEVYSQKMSEGVYLVRLSDGDESYVKKIVIQ